MLSAAPRRRPVVAERWRSANDNHPQRTPRRHAGGEGTALSRSQGRTIMTYLAEAEPQAAAMVEDWAAASAPRAAGPLLSALEWSVIAVARNDSLASLRE